MKKIKAFITTVKWFKAVIQMKPTGNSSPSVTGLSCSATNGDLKFSRQYQDQQENLKNGECIYCREPLLTKRHCKECAEKVRMRNRNRYRKKVGIKLDSPLYGPNRKKAR